MRLALVWLLFVPAAARSQSWLAGFSFRRAVNVSGSSTALVDYPVLVVADSASLRPGCPDVRFTDSDGQTLLPHWTESGCNTASTRFWVKVGALPVSGKTLFMYYGSASEADSSNPTAVNLFYDDFSTDPTARWQNIFRANGSVGDEFSWGGSTLFLTRTTGRGGGGTFATVDPSWENGWAVSFRFRCGDGTGPNGGGDGLAFGFFHQGNMGTGGSLGVALPGYAVELDNVPTNPGDPPYPHLGVTRTSTMTFGHLASVPSSAPDDGLWHSVEVKFSGSRVSVELDKVLVAVVPGAFDKTYRNLLFGAATGGDTNNQEIDDVVLRPHAEPEPSATIGPEEPSSATPPTIPGPLLVLPNPSPGAVTVSWEGSSAAAGSGPVRYELQRSPSAAIDWVSIATSSALSHTEALAQGGYVYRVQAVDGFNKVSGYSATSPVLIVDTTPPTAPGTPEALPRRGPGQYILNWSAADDTGGSGVATYEVWSSSDDGASWKLEQVQSNINLRASLPNGSYRFRVRARDGASNPGPFSPASEPMEVDSSLSASLGVGCGCSSSGAQLLGAALLAGSLRLRRRPRARGQPAD
ncbi:MAG: DUF2341 domain-containing protein [Myxococcota bacterium]